MPKVDIYMPCACKFLIITPSKTQISALTTHKFVKYHLDGPDASGARFCGPEVKSRNVQPYMRRGKALHTTSET